MSDLFLRCPQHVKDEHGLWQPNLEWVDAKLGIPSASQFNRILTKGGVLSRMRVKYMGELLAEWALGEPWDDGLAAKSHWVIRGLELEPEARKWYEMMHAEVDSGVGFVWRDAEKLVGCSPDGLVGDDGGLEIKCPSPATHVMYLSDPNLLLDAYRWQIQGSLWVTGREWWDVMSYCPQLPEVCERVWADDSLLLLDEHMPAFVAEMLARREVLRKQGVEPVGEA